MVAEVGLGRWPHTASCPHQRWEPLVGTWGSSLWAREARVTTRPASGASPWRAPPSPQAVGLADSTGMCWMLWPQRLLEGPGEGTRRRPRAAERRPAPPSQPQPTFQAPDVLQAVSAGVPAGPQAGRPAGLVVPLALAFRVVVVTEQSCREEGRARWGPSAHSGRPRTLGLL